MPPSEWVPVAAVYFVTGVVVGALTAGSVAYSIYLSALIRAQRMLRSLLRDGVSMVDDGSSAADVDRFYAYSEGYRRGILAMDLRPEREKNY